MSATVGWTMTGDRRPPSTLDGTPLVLTVSCPSGDDGRHDVTLMPDWSVDVPHDLEAERVLVAFGGSSPCLTLLRAVDAARTWLELELRWSVPRLEPAGTTSTSNAARPTKRFDCCARPLAVAAAAAHVRSLPHLAVAFDVPVSQLREVVDGLGTAYGIRHGNGPHPDEMREVRHCVHPPTSVPLLWEIGLSPAAIARIYEAIAGESWAALPQSLYESVVLRRPDLAWLEQTLHAPEVPRQEPGPLAQWLVETRTPLDRRNPHARRAWLASGLPWHWIVTLSEAHYTVGDLETLVAGTGLTPIGVARMLSRWVAAGCHPTPDELLRLKSLGIAYLQEHVSAAVVDRLRALLAADQLTLPDTALGLLFVAAGSAVMAHAWVRAGVADPFRVAELVAAGHSPRSFAQRSARTA